jgi:hypothetical protein
MMQIEVATALAAPPPASRPRQHGGRSLRRLAAVGCSAGLAANLWRATTLYRGPALVKNARAAPPAALLRAVLRLKRRIAKALSMPLLTMDAYVGGPARWQGGAHPLPAETGGAVREYTLVFPIRGTKVRQATQADLERK